MFALMAMFLSLFRGNLSGPFNFWNIYPALLFLRGVELNLPLNMYVPKTKNSERIVCECLLKFLFVRKRQF